MNSFRKGMGRLNAGQSQPQIKPNSPNITPRGRANLLMMQRYGRFGMEGANSSQRELIEAAVREATALVGNGLDMEHAKYRSVYLPIVRDQAPRSLDVFDFADASAVTGVRESSNTANQALYMMNNPFVIRQSKGFASRVKQIDGNVSDQIEFLFLLAYARPPTSGESRASEALLRSYGGQARSLSDSTLSVLCQSLFASAEFRYVD